MTADSKMENPLSPQTALPESASRPEFFESIPDSGGDHEQSRYSD
jgi:hypothetical protein